MFNYEARFDAEVLRQIEEERIERDLFENDFVKACDSAYDDGREALECAPTVRSPRL